MITRLLVFVAMFIFQLHVMDSSPGADGVRRVPKPGFQLHVMDSLSYRNLRFSFQWVLGFQLHVMDSSFSWNISIMWSIDFFQLHVMDSCEGHTA